MCFNIARRTTVRELITINGIDEKEFRMQNMGLSAGHVNSLEYCTSMFNAPKPFDVLDMFNEDLKNGRVKGEVAINYIE